MTIKNYILGLGLGAFALNGCASTSPAQFKGYDADFLRKQGLKELVPGSEYYTPEKAYQSSKIKLMEILSNFSDDLKRNVEAYETNVGISGETSKEGTLGQRHIDPSEGKRLTSLILRAADLNNNHIIERDHSQEPPVDELFDLKKRLSRGIFKRYILGQE